MPLMIFFQQCSPMVNNRTLLINQIYYTNERLRDSDNVCGKILKLIDCLNQIKPMAMMAFLYKC